jgi:hypothetical protein
MDAEAAARQREQQQADQEAMDREAERQAKLLEAQGKAEAERIKAEQEAAAAAREEARRDAEHQHKLDKEKRELALKETADLRAGDEHNAKQEERRAKKMIDENTVAETGAKRQSAEQAASVSQEIISTVSALSEAVKGLSSDGETEAEKVGGKWRIRKIKAPTSPKLN